MFITILLFTCCYRIHNIFNFLKMEKKQHINTVTENCHQVSCVAHKSHYTLLSTLERSVDIRFDSSKFKLNIIT